MLDAYWLGDFPAGNYSDAEGSRYYVRFPSASMPLEYPESGDNVRLVAISDAQLSFLLSCVSASDMVGNWMLHFADVSQTRLTLPDSPMGQRANVSLPPSATFGVISLGSLGGSIGETLSAMAGVFVAELQEQLMVDVRPELQSMIAAQNEMSDELDAIRIALEQIAADIEAENNSARLEEIANTIGLLVALL